MTYYYQSATSSSSVPSIQLPTQHSYNNTGGYNENKNFVYDCNRLFQYADNAEIEVLKLINDHGGREARRKRQPSRNTYIQNSGHSSNFMNHDPYDTSTTTASTTTTTSVKTTFGHPNPPNLCMFPIILSQEDEQELSSKNNRQHLYYPTLMIAYTQHTVSAQMMSLHGFSQNPMEICTLLKEEEDDDNDDEYDDDLRIYQSKDEAPRRFDDDKDDYDTDHDDEQITCLTVVELEHLEWFETGMDKEANDEYNQQEVHDRQENSGDFLTTPSDNIKFHEKEKRKEKNDVQKTNNDLDLCYTRIAIVFGTNLNNLYAVEIKVMKRQYNENDHGIDQWSMQLVTAFRSISFNDQVPQMENENRNRKISLIQILPRNDPNCYKNSGNLRNSDSASTNSRVYQTSKNLAPIGTDFQMYPFHPKGGIVSLTSYRVTDQQHVYNPCRPSSSNYVFVTYRDGTFIRIHHCGFFPSIYEKCLQQSKSVSEFLRRKSKNCIIAPLLRCNVHYLPSSLSSPSDIVQNRRTNSNFEATRLPKIVPLPQYYPSPLVLPHTKSLDEQHSPNDVGTTDETSDAPMDGASTTDGDDDDDEQSHCSEDDETTTPSPIIEALVFGQGVQSNVMPTICFYTSERSFVHATSSDDNVLRNSRNGSGRGDGTGEMSERTSSSSDTNNGYVFGSVTKALLGSAIGAIRWGFGSTTTSNSTHNSNDNNRNKYENCTDNPGSQLNDESARSHHYEKQSSSSLAFDGDDDSKTNPNRSSSSSAKHKQAIRHFPTLWHRPIQLYPTTELHDAPRQIEFCTVDPSGTLAAVADGLGRVQLLDLESKQVIRMWKGYREAQCFWHQTMNNVLYPSRIMLHLVIHSRQRRIVEVWKVRHGDRIISKQVGRDAEIISCIECRDGWELSTCYLLHSRITGTSMNHVEIICPVEFMPVSSSHLPDIHGAVMPSGSHGDTNRFAYFRQTSESSILSSGHRIATLRLQHLQQLLSTTSVEFTINDVDRALRDIKSLSDLSAALDLLATAAILENRLGVMGSSFQKNALAHCSQSLRKALERAGRDMKNNPNSDGSNTFRNSFIGHATSVTVLQISHAIQYHTQIVEAFDILEKFLNEKVSDPTSSQTIMPSSWSAESIAWAKTYEQVSGLGLDADSPVESADNILSFYKFASCCAFPKLEDKGNGTINDNKKLVVYFNESSRSRKEVLQKIFKPMLCDVFSFNIVYSILDRLGIRDDYKYVQKCFGEWFMTLPILEIYKKGLYAEKPPMARFLLDLVRQDMDSSSFSDCSIVLSVIYSFCSDSSDLVRAFMLAAMCHEAVSVVVARKEQATYGKIQSNQLTKDWASLLRKLRVCLLVSLRLNGMRLAAPVTINNVNEEGLFSVFEWLALDELQMSHNHQQIVSLEKACGISGYSFDPSLPDGDGPARFKVLQNSCLSASISEEERSEYLVDFEDEDRFGALLLFLGHHNIPPILAAHRVLLLAAKWSSTPIRIDFLKDCVATLKALHASPGGDALAVAVCLEVWQNRICPFYRAQLFGFHDVHELSEDVVASLLKNREWLNDLGRLSLQLLEVVCYFKVEMSSANVFESLLADCDKRTWPPVRPDAVLRRLIEKARPINSSAFDAHSVVVCALLVSGNIEALVQCVPSINELFISQSLFNPVTTSSNVRELQKGYLDNALFTMARDYTGPAIENFELGHINTLAKVWNFDFKSVNTLFILAMYEYGKDRVVDELLTKAASKILVHRFVDNGVDIVCRRLDLFLHGNRMHTLGMHGVLGLLDATLCEWIKHRVAETMPLVESPELDVPIGCTHLFIMRLLSLSANPSVDAGLRIKIHALVVLSGILVKALSGGQQNR